MALRRVGGAMVAMLAVIASLAIAAPAAYAADGDVAMFSTIPDPTPVSADSMAFFSNNITEYGTLAVLEPGTLRDLNRVEVGFSSWACEQGAYNLPVTHPCVTTPGTGFTFPLTVNIYAEGAAGEVGALIGTVTQSTFVPFRPSEDPDDICPVVDGESQFLANGICQKGLYFTSSFDFSSLNLTLPDRVIVSAAFDISDGGDNATPRPPQAYLNVAIDGADPATAGTTEGMTYSAWGGPFSGPSDWGVFFGPQIALLTNVPVPAPVVTTGAWVDGTIACDATTVEQTRTIATQTHKWDATAESWILDPAGISTVAEAGTRNLSAAEVTANACPLPPAPTPVVTTGAWVYGKIICDATTVGQTRTITTQQHKWDTVAKEWVLDPAAIATVTETGNRTLTTAEVTANACGNLATTGADQDPAGAFVVGGALTLAGAALTIMLAIRRKQTAQ